MQKLIIDDVNKKIMNNFNFKNVHKAMKALNWVWGFGSEERIPTLEEIKFKANKMLEDARIGQCYSTGGFKTKKNQTTMLF